MNQKEIWLVVNPTVGLPLFLGAVAATSLIVHASILNHTTWFSAFWNGGAGKVAAVGTTTPAAASVASTSGTAPVLVVAPSDPQAALVASAANDAVAMTAR